MKIQICLLASILLFSCSEKKDNSGKTDGSGKTDYSSTIIAEDPTEEELKKELSESELEKISNITSMRFDKTLHDYGKVIVDTDNKAFFTVTNTGDKPLIIESVFASCGCTRPKKPENPIPPGKSDRIEVVFHPRDGQLDAQEKSITVSANTDSKMEVLKIKAFVLPK
ncbi:MAG: hypothetical protein RL528_1070 [Bacteroidota bacterium]